MAGLEEQERRLVHAVFKAVNSPSLPADPSVPLKKGALRRAVTGLSKEMESLIADDTHLAKEQWRLWWQTERVDIRADFEELALNGRLSRYAATAAAELFRQEVVVTPVVTVEKGRAHIAYRPQFRSVSGAAAYVLLRLSAADGAHFGVCKKCGDLWLDDRAGRGKHRKYFCSVAHQNAYGQAEHRRRKSANGRDSVISGA